MIIMRDGRRSAAAVMLARLLLRVSAQCMQFFDGIRVQSCHPWSLRSVPCRDGFVPRTYLTRFLSL